MTLANWCERNLDYSQMEITFIKRYVRFYCHSGNHSHHGPHCFCDFPCIAGQKKKETESYYGVYPANTYGNAQANTSHTV